MKACIRMEWGHRAEWTGMEAWIRMEWEHAMDRNEGMHQNGMGTCNGEEWRHASEWNGDMQRQGMDTRDCLIEVLANRKMFTKES